MEISQDLYTWLRASNIISAPSKHKKSPQIPEPEQENFEYGNTFALILSRTISLLQQTEKKILLKNLIDNIKPYKTSYSKKRNWSVIKIILSELGIQVDNDNIELIKAGSRETLEQLLELIFEYEQNIFVQSESESTPKFKKSPNRYKSGELVIEAINGSIELENTKSCLEFLLVTFCKHFALHPKQAAGLLTQSGKYLAYICSKGFKGKHEIIGFWLSDVLLYSKHLAQLIFNENQQAGLSLVLTSLSHSLNSRSLENVLKVSKIFLKLIEKLYELGPNNELNQHFWTWFSSTGIESCLLCLKRFGAYIKHEVVSILCTFSKDNYLDLFTVIFPEQIPEIIQYLAFIHELLLSFLSSPHKNLIISQGVIDFLLDLALEQAENLLIQPDERMTAINIICEIWSETPTIENSENYSSRVIKTFEKISREKSVLLKISCLGRFFSLLEKFALSKNSHAPVLYKIITFALVENYSEMETKEFIINNFLYLFDQIEVPLKILLEPLSKHLTISGVYDFNLLDFHFFSKIGRHDQLNVKFGLMFVDSLAKLFVEHEFYAKVIGEIILDIIERFSDEIVFQEYLVKFIKVYLKIVEKGSNHLERVKGLMWIVQNCINMQIGSVNHALEEVICQQLVKNSSQKFSSWLMTLLQICGNPLEIIENYKRLTKLIETPVLPAKKPKEVQIFHKQEENSKGLVPKKTLRKQVESKIIEDTASVPSKTKQKKLIEPILNEDLELLKIHMKSKKYMFLEVFKKYSTKRKILKVETFEQINTAVNTIADSDIFKLLKKVLEPSLVMSQSHFVEFSKEFCQMFQKAKSFFEFSEFQYFLAYISCQIYVKPPVDYSLHPPIYSFLILTHTLEQEFGLKKQESQYIDPNHDPPAGFKKLKTKEIQLHYKTPANLNFSIPHEISFNLIDDLLFSLFNFHFLEPQISVTELYKLQQDFINPQSKSNSVQIHLNSPKKITNKFEEKKQREKLEKINEKKMKEKKRNLRVQLVKSLIMKTGNLTQKKVKEKKRVEIDEEKKLVLIKKLEEKIERDRKLRIEEIAMWKNKKEEENKKKFEMDKEKLDKERDLRIRRREEFLENEKLRLRKLSLDIAESKKILPKIEAEKESIEKKLREKKIEKHKTTLELARKNKEQSEVEEKGLVEDFNSESVQSLVKLYEKPMQLIFSHFCNSKHVPNNEESILMTFMVFGDFYRFAKQFKIVPEIVSKDECKKLFIMVMKNNENSAILFEGFKFLCFKISKAIKREDKSSEEILREFIAHLELSKDVNTMRNVLRRQETLKSTKG